MDDLIIYNQQNTFDIAIGDYVLFQRKSIPEHKPQLVVEEISDEFITGTVRAVFDAHTEGVEITNDSEKGTTKTIEKKHVMAVVKRP
jgi:hypothetical protein